MDVSRSKSQDKRYTACGVDFVPSGLSKPEELEGYKPSPVPADGWRPIETAPKDGTWVLVWDCCRCKIASNYYDHDQRDEWTTDGEGFLIQPKLWQPLPPRPQEKGGEA